MSELWNETQIQHHTIVKYPRQTLFDVIVEDRYLFKSIPYKNYWETENICLFHIGNVSFDSTTYYLIANCIIEFTYHNKILDIKIIDNIVNIITERGIINIGSFGTEGSKVAKLPGSIETFIDTKEAKLPGARDYLMIEIIGCEARCKYDSLSSCLKKYKHRYLPTMTRY